MTQHDDDEALSWDDGTDDSTHVDGRTKSAPAAAAGGGEVDDIAPGTGSALLVTYGIIAGAYLLFTVGWILAALRDTYSVTSLLGEIMYQLGQFLAIAAPVLWFGTVFLLGRKRTAVVKIVWLIIGAALLAPWPFILSGGAA